MRLDFVLDTNLAVLLVVGTMSSAAIARHKRLGDYDAADFVTLKAALGAAGRVIVPPQVFAETSNLLGRGNDPFHRGIAEAFAAVAEAMEESHVAARVAVRRPEFARLGLTDAVLLELSARGSTLLTADEPLYHAALSAGCDAVNFAHLRAHAASLD